MQTRRIRTVRALVALCTVCVGITTVQATVQAQSARRGVATVPLTDTARDSVLARIAQFGFDSRPKVGVGGFVTVDIYPIVLFRDGEALTDVRALQAAGGLDAHKRAVPEAWTQWRSGAAGVELLKKGAWKPLPFKQTYPRLPDGLTLDGRYRALAGVGTRALGGDAEAVAWDEYRFTSDGAVVRTGGAGARAATGEASVATGSSAAARRGRYRVDGLRLQITYDDGSMEQRVLITDPSSPGALWLDGEGFVKRKSPGPT